MDDKLRQTSYTCNPCPTLGVQTGTIIVRQVIGERERQKVLDIHIVVPDAKPSIEQIVDVFVKDVCVHCVEVITDKVIVRGDFEIKAIYVADLPEQPVHAVEIRHYKFTQDIDLPGARKGMDADASVLVEFVDYDFDEHHHHHHCRAYKYKYGGYHHDDCDDDGPECGSCPDPDDDHDDCKDHHHHKHCLREFDVSVVLKIIAKVLADREVNLSPTASIPSQPKG